MKISSLASLLERKDGEIDSDNQLVDDSTFVGVEVEVEQLTFFNLDGSILDNKYWQFTGEDSIREGVELIFRQPLKGKDIYKALLEYDNLISIIKNLTSNNPVITDRCSLHVHIDMTNAETSQVNDFTMVYALFEKIFFQMLKPSRYSSNYCIPLITTDFGNIINKLGTKSAAMYLHTIRSSCDKYGSLNYLSLLKYGSIEIRSHPGSLNYIDILLWVNVLLSIKKWVFEGNRLTPFYLKKADPNVLTKEIFGEYSDVLMNTNFFLENFNVGRYWALETLVSKKLAKITKSKIIK